MEELDLTLVATQQNAVSLLLKAEGFDPSDFEWEKTQVDEMRKDAYAIAFRYTVSKLVHVRSRYYFQFEKYRSRYSPAHQLRTRIEPWPRLIDRDDHLRDWLFHLRLELSEESQMETMDDGKADLPADESPAERGRGATAATGPGIQPCASFSCMTWRAASAGDSRGDPP